MPERRYVPPLSVAAAVLAAVLALVAGCEDSAPPAGEACTAGGGKCSVAACGESLPYPCPGTETCCRPPPAPPPGDAGGG